ncbi:MAG TPA: two-component regulator propeller domain-containing protein, partial [Thermoanaerobaculia bacterium]|nr:two-component regulator propeller domain-containing protein [Thermoanaerobaculia bacterium]
MKRLGEPLDRRRSRGRGAAPAAALAAALLCAPAAAQRYPVRTFTERDGLRSSTVHDLAQDGRGRMWFLTRAGVVGYDGFEWAAPDSRPSHRFFGYRFLEIDPDGDVWVAGEQSGLPLLRVTGPMDVGAELATPAPGSAAAEHRTAFAALTEAGGTLLALGTRGAGLHVRRRGRWTTFGPEQGLPHPSVLALAPAGERLFVGTAGGLASLAGGRLDPSPTELLPPGRRDLRALAWDAEAEALWLVGPTWAGRISEGRFQLLADGLEIPPDPDRLQLVAETDGRGGLFFGSATRLHHLDGGSGEVIVLGPRNGFAADGATGLELDRELNLWVATPRGVSLLPSLRFATWDSRQGLLEDEVSAAVEWAPGELVLGHNGGLTVFRDGEPVRTLALEREELAGVPLGRVMDLEVAADGALWVAMGHLGLARIARGGEPRWLGGGPELDRRIDAVRIDPRGGLLLGTGAGLARLVDGAIVPFAPPELGRPRVRRAVFSRDGTLYLATPGEGVHYRPNGQGWRQARGSLGPEDDVFTVVEDAAGRIWVGSAAGLLVLDGERLERPGPEALRIERPVYALIEDPEGWLWIGTDAGFFRWDGARLDHYTVRDGLAGQEANRAAALVDGAGRLWLGTDGGVSLVRDRSARRALLPPRVSLLGIEVDGRSYPPDEPLEIGHRQNRVSFRVAAVSFRDESRIEYRTWLRGDDSGWVVATGPARLESRYSALPPGTYAFAVQARTDRSGWSEVVATAPVTIGRPFWLQAWFLACVALVLVALGIAGHRLHAQRRYARRLEREVTLRTAELAASRSSIEAERERLERTVESVADGLAATGPDRRVVLWNRSAEQITGRSAAEAIGRPLEEVLPLAVEGVGGPDDDADGFVDVLEAILEHGEQPRVPGVYRLAGRSGEPRVLELTGAPTGGAAGSGGAVVAFRDVTGRRRLEQDLVKAQKLESLGVLAGGIAHDFNNLLTVILGYLSLVQASPRLTGRELEGLEHAQRALGRAQELSRRLLTFAQGGTPVTGAVSVPRLVRECAELTCHGSAVRCELELPDDLWPAEADEGQLSQVLNNLLINALQATPEGGVVTVSADNRDLPGDDGTGLPPGRYVHLRVADRGAGIPPETLPRIFDPFFTTRKGGSGLGLTTAYSIVRQHGGAIRV